MAGPGAKQGGRGPRGRGPSGRGGAINGPKTIREMLLWLYYLGNGAQTTGQENVFAKTTLGNYITTNLHLQLMKRHPKATSGIPSVTESAKGLIETVCEDAGKIIVTIQQGERYDNGKHSGELQQEAEAKQKNFEYPKTNDGKDLYDCFVYYVTACYWQLQFLYKVCDVDKTQGGWKECRFGQSQPLEADQCKTNGGNENHDKRCTHCSSGYKECLMGFLTEGAGGRARQRTQTVSNIYKEAEYRGQCLEKYKIPAPRSEHCLVPPMGFPREKLPARLMEGNNLHNNLDPYFKDNSKPFPKMLGHLKLLQLLSTRGSTSPLSAPSSWIAGDFWAFFYQLKEFWNGNSRQPYQGFRDKLEQKIKGEYPSGFKKQNGSPSTSKADFQDLNEVFSKLLFAEHNNNDHNSLLSLSECDGSSTNSTNHCGKYLDGLFSDPFYWVLHWFDNEDNNISLLSFEVLNELAKELKRKLEAFKKGLERSDKSKQCATKHSSSCKCIVWCDDTHSVIYRYGFTFQSPHSLKIKSRKCKDLKDQLIKVIGPTAALEVFSKLEKYVRIQPRAKPSTEPAVPAPTVKPAVAVKPAAAKPVASKPAATKPAADTAKSGNTDQGGTGASSPQTGAAAAQGVSTVGGQQDTGTGPSPGPGTNAQTAQSTPVAPAPAPAAPPGPPPPNPPGSANEDTDTATLQQAGGQARSDDTDGGTVYVSSDAGVVSARVSPSQPPPAVLQRSEISVNSHVGNGGGGPSSADQLNGKVQHDSLTAKDVSDATPTSSSPTTTQSTAAGGSSASPAQASAQATDSAGTSSSSSGTVHKRDKNRDGVANWKPFTEGLTALLTFVKKASIRIITEINAHHSSLLEPPCNIKECLEWLDRVCTNGNKDCKCHQRQVASSCKDCMAQNLSNAVCAILPGLNNSKPRVNKNIVQSVVTGASALFNALKGPNYQPAYKLSAQWPTCGPTTSGASSGVQCSSCQDKDNKCNCQYTGSSSCDGQCCNRCDVRICAGIFIAMVPALHRALEELRDKLKGNNGTTKISDTPVVGYLQHLGYEDKDLSTTTQGSSVPVKLITPIANLRKLSEYIKDAFEKNYSKKKDTVPFHFQAASGAKSASSQCASSFVTCSSPTSIREMLLWLMGLPYCEGYKEFVDTLHEKSQQEPFKSLLEQNYKSTRPSTTASTADHYLHRQYSAVIFQLPVLFFTVEGTVSYLRDTFCQFAPEHNREYLKKISLDQSNDCNNHVKSFQYPCDGDKLCTMFYDYTYKVHLQLRFLLTMCTVDSKDGGWKHCRLAASAAVCSAAKTGAQECCSKHNLLCSCPDKKSQRSTPASNSCRQLLREFLRDCRNKDPENCAEDPKNCTTDSSTKNPVTKNIFQAPCSSDLHVSMGFLVAECSHTSETSCRLICHYAGETITEVLSELVEAAKGPSRTNNHDGTLSKPLSVVTQWMIALQGQEPRSLGDILDLFRELCGASNVRNNSTSALQIAVRNGNNGNVTMATLLLEQLKDLLEKHCADCNKDNDKAKKEKKVEQHERWAQAELNGLRSTLYALVDRQHRNTAQRHTAQTITCDSDVQSLVSIMGGCNSLRSMTCTAYVKSLSYGLYHYYAPEFKKEEKNSTDHVLDWLFKWCTALYKKLRELKKRITACCNCCLEASKRNDSNCTSIVSCCKCLPELYKCGLVLGDPKTLIGNGRNRNSKKCSDFIHSVSAVLATSAPVFKACEAIMTTVYAVLWSKAKESVCIWIEKNKKGDILLRKVYERYVENAVQCSKVKLMEAFLKPLCQDYQCKDCSTAVDSNASLCISRSPVTSITAVIPQYCPLVIDPFTYRAMTKIECCENNKGDECTEGNVSPTTHGNVFSASCYTFQSALDFHVSGANCILPVPSNLRSAVDWILRVTTGAPATGAPATKEKQNDSAVECQEKESDCRDGHKKDLSCDPEVAMFQRLAQEISRVLNGDKKDVEKKQCDTLSSFNVSSTVSQCQECNALSTCNGSSTVSNTCAQCLLRNLAQGLRTFVGYKDMTSKVKGEVCQERNTVRKELCSLLECLKGFLCNEGVMCSTVPSSVSSSQCSLSAELGNALLKGRYSIGAEGAQKSMMEILVEHIGIAIDNRYEQGTSFKSLVTMFTTALQSDHKHCHSDLKCNTLKDCKDTCANVSKDTCANVSKDTCATNSPNTSTNNNCVPQGLSLLCDFFQGIQRFACEWNHIGRKGSASKGSEAQECQKKGEQLPCCSQSSSKVCHFAPSSDVVFNERRKAECLPWKFNGKEEKCDKKNFSQDCPQDCPNKECSSSSSPLSRGFFQQLQCGLGVLGQCAERVSELWNVSSSVSLPATGTPEQCSASTAQSSQFSITQYKKRICALIEALKRFGEHIEGCKFKGAPRGCCQKKEKACATTCNAVSHDGALKPAPSVKCSASCCPCRADASYAVDGAKKLIEETKKGVEQYITMKFTEKIGAAVGMSTHENMLHINSLLGFNNKFTEIVLRTYQSHLDDLKRLCQWLYRMGQLYKAGLRDFVESLVKHLEHIVQVIKWVEHLHMTLQCLSLNATGSDGLSSVRTVQHIIDNILSSYILKPAHDSLKMSGDNAKRYRGFLHDLRLLALDRYTLQVWQDECNKKDECQIKDWITFENGIIRHSDLEAVKTALQNLTGITYNNASPSLPPFASRSRIHDFHAICVIQKFSYEAPITRLERSLEKLKGIKDKLEGVKQECASSNNVSQLKDNEDVTAFCDSVTEFLKEPYGIYQFAKFVHTIMGPNIFSAVIAALEHLKSANELNGKNDSAQIKATSFYKSVEGLVEGPEKEIAGGQKNTDYKLENICEKLTKFLATIKQEYIFAYPVVCGIGSDRDCKAVCDKKPKEEHCSTALVTDTDLISPLSPMPLLCPHCHLTASISQCCVPLLARMFITLVPILYPQLCYLAYQCRLYWQQDHMNGYKDSALSSLMRTFGFEGKDLYDYLDIDVPFSGTHIDSVLTKETNSLQILCDDISTDFSCSPFNTDSPFYRLYTLCLEYYQRRKKERLTHCSKTASCIPTNLREILRFFVYLPFSTQFQSLQEVWRSYCSQSRLVYFSDVFSTMMMSSAMSAVLLQLIECPQGAFLRFFDEIYTNTEGYHFGNNTETLFFQLCDLSVTLYRSLKFLSLQCGTEPSLVGWRDCSLRGVKKNSDRRDITQASDTQGLQLCASHLCDCPATGANASTGATQCSTPGPTAATTATHTTSCPLPLLRYLTDANCFFTSAFTVPSALRKVCLNDSCKEMLYRHMAPRGWEKELLQCEHRDEQNKDSQLEFCDLKACCSACHLKDSDPVDSNCGVSCCHPCRAQCCAPVCSTLTGHDLFHVLRNFVGHCNDADPLLQFTRCMVSIAAWPPDSLSGYMTFMLRFSDQLRKEERDTQGSVSVSSVAHGNTTQKKNSNSSVLSSLKSEISLFPGEFDPKCLIGAFLSVTHCEHNNGAASSSSGTALPSSSTDTSSSFSPSSLPTTSSVTISILSDCKDCNHYNCIIYPLDYEVYDLYLPMYARRYLTWMLHFGPRLHRGMRELEKEFKRHIEDGKGSKSGASATDTGVSGSAASSHGTANASILQCPFALPELHAAGLHFWDPNRMCTVSCQCLVERLHCTLQDSSLLAEFVRRCDSFLWSVRKPFYWLTMALWIIATVYLLFVHFWRLDSWRLLSHVIRSRASHLVYPKVLLAAEHSYEQYYAQR